MSNGGAGVKKWMARLHRWLGLTSALFLFVAGLTGAIISWDHELDEWLNGQLYDIDSHGAYQSPLALADQLEANDPRIRVSFFPLQFEPGHAAVYYVKPAVNPATGQLYELDYNQVFVNPVTGAIVGTRDWGKIALDREHLLPFLYKLHYSFQLPDFAGIDRWGYWLMGGVALIWLFDTFIAAYLTLPSRRSPPSVPAGGRAVSDNPRRFWQRWAPAWKVKWNASAFRLNYSLHLAAGLWVFSLLLILALTSVSLNLYAEVFRPLLEKVSTLTPDPFTQRRPQPLTAPIEPQLDRQAILADARQLARHKGWSEPAGSLFYASAWGIYGVGFFQPGDDHEGGGMRMKWLYLDGDSGAELGARVPWQGTAADIFVQLQFPLHSGRILGLPGRVIISLMGLVVAMLSLTGVIIWAKKRKARRKQARYQQQKIQAVTVSPLATTATLQPAPGAIRPRSGQAEIR